MRVQITRSKNAENFYIVKSVRKFGKNTNVVIEKLGNIDKVRERANGKDPYEWAEEYARELTLKEKDLAQKIQVRLRSQRHSLKAHIRPCHFTGIQVVHYGVLSDAPGKAEL